MKPQQPDVPPEAPERPRSPLWMLVLSLCVEAPVHPYRMQQLIKERGKDQVVNVAQRTSVYQTIAALERAGLITATKTTRAAKRPERTVYAATKRGRATLTTWLQTALAMPAREFPELPAALSLLPALTPKQALIALRARLATQEQRLTELTIEIPGLPRLFLVEAEYMAQLVRAEIEWLRGMCRDLETKKLGWSEAWLRKMAAQLGAAT